ncbi:MAG: YihY/virulence factor BrkB family protein [Anaerolineales bacterium]
MTQKIRRRIGKAAQWLFKVFKRAVHNFQRQEASRAAAGMTYYFLFSLSPLLIVMVTVASYFVAGTQVNTQIKNLMTSVIPVSQSIVERNIQRIMEVRNSIGVIGSIGFLWSASNAFSILVDNINRAWPETERRSFVQKRLLGLTMVGVIIVLLILLMLSSTVFDLIDKIDLSFTHNPQIAELNLVSLIADAISWVSPFLFFLSLYLLLPRTRVNLIAGLISAIFITCIWKGASFGFNWYLSSGLARYQFVYGSLSAIVVLLFWIYLSSLIIFFGAHLCKSLSDVIPAGGKKEEVKFQGKAY